MQGTCQVLFEGALNDSLDYTERVEYMRYENKSDKSAAPTQVLESKSVEGVSFVSFKEVFRKLPSESLVRRMVLAEPDRMSREEALRKAVDYLELYEKIEKGKEVFPSLRH